MGGLGFYGRCSVRRNFFHAYPFVHTAGLKARGGHVHHTLVVFAYRFLGHARRMAADHLRADIFSTAANTAFDQELKRFFSHGSQRSAALA